MEEADNPATETEMKSLREGIKKKYEVYHRQDGKRFPKLEYNTNRLNYEPLVDSFREEFYAVRGVDRAKNTIHIPSTKTFAAIFCDDLYRPGKKILNTCRSFVEGASLLAGTERKTALIQVTPIPPKPGKLSVAGIVLLASAIIYLAIRYLYPAPSASGLIIQRPQNKQLVSRKSLIEGRVSNADTVWVMVRPQKKDEYYFQPPIKVNPDGTWMGEIYVGSASEESVGFIFEVRAFVKPVGAPESMEVLETTVPTSWPEAELSSTTIEIVRGPKKK